MTEPINLYRATLQCGIKPALGPGVHEWAPGEPLSAHMRTKREPAP